MGAILPTAVEHVEARIQADLAHGRLYAVEGTLQRVGYKTRELKVIANGQVWMFTLDRDCQLWFDDRPALLRCFHPLDAVKVIFARTPAGDVVKALYAREKQFA